MSKNKNITNNKNKKYLSIFAVAVVILVIGGFFLLKKPAEKSVSQNQCQAKEMIFYYLDACGWCQKVKSEGTIAKIKDLGVEVKEINAAIGPVRHQFEGVPTFVINEKVYSGYKTFDELSNLLGCPTDDVQNQDIEDQSQTPPPVQTEKDFLGEKGQNLIFENTEVKIDAAQFDDNQARFFNVETANGKTIYFFVVKDKSGIYRAAANACQVCYGERKGFHQEGDEIVCNNCGNRYPLEKIATEKGGCNPGPISPNLEIKDGQIIIKQADLEQVSDLF